MAASTQFRLANQAGSAAVGLPVPASNALVGLRLAVQAFALDGPAPAGFAANSGRLVVVGGCVAASRRYVDPHQVP